MKKTPDLASKSASSADPALKKTSSPAKHDSAPIKLTIHLSRNAAKILSEEEAQMLIKWSWEEMEKKKKEGYNLFRFPKLGVCVVRDKEELVILTDEEQRNALAKEETKE